MLLINLMIYDSVLETVTKNAYSYAQENVRLSVLTEQIEESK